VPHKFIVGREIAPLLVKVRRSGSGWVGSVQVGRVKAVGAGCGSARWGAVSQGGCGKVWCGGAWWFMVGQGGLGWARCGELRTGKLRCDGSRRSRFGRVWRGMERLGKAVGVWCVLAWSGRSRRSGFGVLRSGGVSFGEVRRSWCGSVRYVTVRWVKAVKVRRGGAWSGWSR
jgi:hypothetical protein